MTWLKRSLIALGAILLAGAVALGWLMGTGSGLHFVLARVENATGGALQVRQAKGRLAGPLTLTGVRYRNAGSGLEVHADRVQLDLRVAALLLGQVHLQQLRVTQLDVALPTKPPRAPASAPGPLDLRAPVDIVLDSLRVDGIRVHRGKKDLFIATSLDLAGAWSNKNIALHQLRLHAPDGHVEFDGRMALGKGNPGRGTLVFDWKTGSRHWTGKLQVDNNGRHAHASIALTRPSATQLHLTLAPRAPFAWQARLSLPRTQAAPWLDKRSSGRIAASLDAHGDAYHAHMEGTFEFGSARLRLAALDLQRSRDESRLRLERLQLTSPQHPGQLEGTGSIDLKPSPASAQLRLAWKGVTLPAGLVGQPMASNGRLDLQGNIDRYRIALDAEVGPSSGKPSKLHAQLLGTPGQLAIERIRIQQPRGTLEAHGVLHTAPRTSWQIDATAHHFDPGMLLAGWNGSLDARLSTRGRVSSHGTAASLDLGTLAGTLRQRRVDGRGKLALSADKVVSGTLDLRSGSSHLRLRGAAGARNDLDLNLGIASLGDWLPAAHGALQSRLRIRGQWPQLGVSGTIDGNELAWRKARIGRLGMNLDLPDIRHPGGTLAVRASDVHAAGFNFTRLSLDGRGNRRHHTLDMHAEGRPLSLRLTLLGGMHGDAWQGSLQRLDLGLSGRPTWHLRAPATLAWNRGQASLGQLCLSPGQPLLCISAARRRDSSLEARYRMRDLPLELVLALAANDLPMRADGTLSGTGNVQRGASGGLQGQASLESKQGTIFYTDEPNQPLLRFRGLNANLTLSPRQQQLRIGASLQQNGRLDGNLSVHGPQHVLDGHLTVQLGSLGFVELFTSEVANLKGRLKADVDLAGTLEKPGVRGDALVDGFSGEIPALGLKLRQGRLHLSGSDARQLRIDGQVRSGTGTLRIAGTVGLGNGAASNVTLSGDKVQVADIPSATVSVSPDLDIRHSPSGLRIDGKVRVDKADVKLEKLPGAGTTQASPDVVVVDASKPRNKPTPVMQVATDIHVDLGSHTHVTGYGLDGDLHGDLHVVGPPGKTVLGQGQIGIEGTFRAYGQDLNIEQGRLLFASTPLDDPGLDIRAVRKLHPNATVSDGEVVGLQVRGTAKHPQLTVFSNPVMEQSDALSYLITGKPLSQVSGGEGSTVNAAAQALGSVTGDMLAKSVGSRLGISDIGVSSSDALGTTAFTIGKYLSPRLYLSYGVGLFEPGQVITLRYILSRRWNFEAQQATGFSRASFNYRYEH